MPAPGAVQTVRGNIADLPCRVTLVVAAGSEKDEALIESVYRAHPARTWPTSR